MRRVTSETDLGQFDHNILDSDSDTFGSRLPPGAVSIVPAPADIPDWEHSLTTGEAVTATLPAGESLSGAYRQNGSEIIPLAVISNGERHPYSPDANPSDEEQLIVLRRSGTSTVDQPEQLAAVDV